MGSKLIADKEGTVLHLEDAEEWVIGSDPNSCHLVIDDPSVAKQHLLAHKTPQGISLEPISPDFLTWINETLLEEETPLQEGDQVRIGDQLFRFSAEKEREEEPDQELLEEISDEEQRMLAGAEFTLHEGGRWMFKVLTGPNSGAEFPMQLGEEYLVGTDPNLCDVVLHDASISRRHAKISLSERGEVEVEDLGSKNGTFLEDKQLKERVEISSGAVLAVGTTKFCLYDQEGDQDTLLTPAFVAARAHAERERPKREEEESREAPPAEPEQQNRGWGGMAALVVAAALLAGVIGTGTSLLFQETAIEEPDLDSEVELRQALARFPEIQYSFNEASGELLLVGHVAKTTDRRELMYNLHRLPFVKKTDDDHIVVDELVVRESNLQIGKNPKWRGITLHSPRPGQFVLAGYIQDKKDAAALREFTSQRFPYLDRLEQQIMVEEEELEKIENILERRGLGQIDVQMVRGELSLSGALPEGGRRVLKEALEEVQGLKSVRTLKNYIAFLEPEATIIDISDSYRVTGSSLGGNTRSIVIQGRILSAGDQLDGMIISEVTPNRILLERGGVKYKIDYNR